MKTTTTCWLLVLSSLPVLAFATSTTTQVTQLQREQIERAAELLEVSGVSELCHPSSNHLAPAFPQCQPSVRHHHGWRKVEREAEETWFYARNCGCVLICVSMAALAAGLTIGLLSLDPLVLLIKMRAGSTEAEKAQAASLLPIVKQHHQLLVTLLLLNSMANEALPLFLDAMVPSFVAVIISVTLVLFFGEIIPSAVFTGPDQLKIASRLTPVVRIVMFTLSPLAYPIARALDVILHEKDESGSTYNRSELAALVRILYEERLATKQRQKAERMEMKHESDSTHPQDPPIPPDIEIACHRHLRSVSKELFDIQHDPEARSRATDRWTHQRVPSMHIDEVSMVEGALQMKTKLALDVYTPMAKVFAIPFDMILTEKNVVKIYSRGFSRIPVYMPNPQHAKDKQAICGVLMTKQLIVVSMSDNRRVSTLPLQVPHCISPTMNMVDLLNLFQTGGFARKGGHLALVCKRPDIGNQALQLGLPVPETAGLLGIVTMENVLEQLLQEEIFDESDRRERVSAQRVAKALRQWKLLVKKNKLARQENNQSQRDPNFVDAAATLQAKWGDDSTDSETATPTEGSPLLGSRRTDETFWSLRSIPSFFGAV